MSSSCVCAYSQQQTPLTPRRVAAEEGELLFSCGGIALRLQEAVLRAGEDGYGVPLCGAVLAYVSQSCALLARDTSVLDWLALLQVVKFLLKTSQRKRWREARIKNPTLLGEKKKLLSIYIS